MKKIGIDARLYLQTGVGIYLQNLLYWLEQKAPSDVLFNIYLRGHDFDKITFKNKKFIKKKSNYHWHSIQEQFVFGRQLLHDQLDLMHFTYFSYPIVYKKRFIATIHDLTPLLFKTGRASSRTDFIYNLKHFFLKIVLASQIKNSKMIITPTRTVKNQIVEIYGEKYKEKINPIYEGINLNLINTKENNSLKKSYKDFFIYVGNFYPHKNIESLIYAFSKINTNHKLILIGPNDFFSTRVFRLINKLKQEDRILFFKNPTLADLVFFYKNAEALIHPSLSEGFGLPIIEAMHFDLPIIASDIPVFKEILKDQYLSFDPTNIDDMKEKIEFFLENRKSFEYGKLIEQYSFEQMAEKTLNLYLKNI